MFGGAFGFLFVFLLWLGAAWFTVAVTIELLAHFSFFVAIKVSFVLVNHVL